MAEAFAYPGEPRGQRLAHFRTPVQRHRRRNPGLPALLVVTFLTLILGLLLETNRPTLAAEPSPAEPQVVPPGPLTFENCVQLAIHQSPYFTKTALEIEVRQIDENDSRFAVFPPHVTFRSYYYVDRPNYPGFTPHPYNLMFLMEPYNPFGSYFTLQAQKAATQMTIFLHLQLISQGLERLGRMFLSLGAMKQLAAFQSDVVNLCRDNLTYAENRRTIGTGTSLEARLATQELEMAKNELARLEGDRRRTLSSLKNFIGLKPEQTTDLDLRDARRQVLGSFAPADATLEQAKARSFELKAMALKMELQGYNVALAKAKVLPNVLFTTQTPDPLSITSARGFYVGLGLEVPIWDGFNRIRNISRQKTILKQIGSEKDLKELELADKWNDLQETITANSAGVNLAKSQEELARLKERQAEISYDSGSNQLPAWLEARKAVLDAQKGAASKALEYDQLILNLRQLSGDLGYSYVNEKSWHR